MARYWPLSLECSLTRRIHLVTFWQDELNKWFLQFGLLAQTYSAIISVQTFIYWFEKPYRYWPLSLEGSLTRIHLVTLWQCSLALVDLVDWTHNFQSLRSSPQSSEGFWKDMRWQNIINTLFWMKLKGFISTYRYEASFDLLLHSVTSEAERARLLSVSMESASNWLHTIPIPSLSLHFRCKYT